MEPNKSALEKLLDENFEMIELLLARERAKMKERCAHIAELHGDVRSAAKIRELA